MARSAAMAMVGHQTEAIYVVPRSPMKRCSNAGEQLAAPATQLAPAKANGYVILAHVPLYLR